MSTEVINGTTTYIFKVKKKPPVRKITVQPVANTNTEYYLPNHLTKQNHLVIKSDLSIEYINARIKQEFCYETFEELTDAKLICEYKIVILLKMK
jgi:hypothetical protein